MSGLHKADATNGLPIELSGLDIFLRPILCFIGRLDSPGYLVRQWRTAWKHKAPRSQRRCSTYPCQQCCWHLLWFDRSVSETDTYSSICLSNPVRPEGEQFKVILRTIKMRIRTLYLPISALGVRGSNPGVKYSSSHYKMCKSCELLRLDIFVITPFTIVFVVVEMDYRFLWKSLDCLSLERWSINLLGVVNVHIIGHPIKTSFGLTSEM